MEVDHDAAQAALDAKRAAIEAANTLEVMPLGAGNEVGRSCIVLRFKGKTIMLDCGVHPAYTGLAGLPYFDEIEPEEIDLLLISHFHLDHCAALPYFLEKTAFAGKVYMTYPTKAIYKLLLRDFVKVSAIGDEAGLFDERGLRSTMERIETLNYHQEVEACGVRFTAYNAGHVLGAAMFLIEIGGVKILYTGDYSRGEDRHLMAAETPACKPDLLIVESTYGVQVHEPRVEREALFTNLVHDIVRRGGRCLIPVFALGRAQELLLILEEYWNAHARELSGVPIYYASALAKKCMLVYQTFINMMNERIRKQYALANPFVFRRIANLKSIEAFDDSGPCVVMASPGMLQSGLSRELFDIWAPDKRNGLVIPGYCVEGTLAKYVMTSPDTVPTLLGQQVPLNMSVHYVSFSAHCDYAETSEFVELLQPPHIVLVHGDANEMSRLKGALNDKYAGKNVQVLTPKNCQAVSIQYKGDQMAKVVGELAAQRLKKDVANNNNNNNNNSSADSSSGGGGDGGGDQQKSAADGGDTAAIKQEVDVSSSASKREVDDKMDDAATTTTTTTSSSSSTDATATGTGAPSSSPAASVEHFGPIAGLFVRKDFNHHIMAPEDLPQYTSLSIQQVQQRLYVPCSLPFMLLLDHLRALHRVTTLDSVLASDESSAAADATGEASSSSSSSSAAAAEIQRFRIGSAGGGQVDVSYVPGDAAADTASSSDDASRETHLILEFTSTPMTDMLADSVISMVMQVSQSPASVRVAAAAAASSSSSSSSSAATGAAAADDAMDADVDVGVGVGADADAGATPAPLLLNPTEEEQGALLTHFLRCQLGTAAVELDVDTGLITILDDDATEVAVVEVASRAVDGTEAHKVRAIKAIIDLIGLPPIDDE